MIYASSTFFKECELCSVRAIRNNVLCSSLFTCSPIYPGGRINVCLGWIFAFDDASKYTCQSKHLKGQLWPPLGDVFVYSCSAPLPGQLWPTPGWRFCVFLPCPPPRSVVTPPGWRFCLFLPWPPPVQSCYDWIKHNIWQKNLNI